MTAKETFLKRIADQIKALQEVYNNSKHLSNDIFEGLTIPNWIEPPSPIVQKSNGMAIKEEPLKEDSEYGRNKKLIVQILNTAKKALLKSEIEQEFRKMITIPKDESNIMKMVTNALSSLVTDGVVKGYKPEDFKLRGNFWALSTWWNNELLKPEYRPKASEYSKRQHLFE